MTHSRGRLAVLAVLIAALISVLFGRTVQLQASDAADYQAAANGNSVRTSTDPAPRGLILDQVGRPLASDRRELQVVVDRAVLYALPTDGRDVVARLAGQLGTTFKAIDQKLTPCGSESAVPGRCWDGQAGDRIVVASDVPMERALPLIEQPDRFPGVGVRTVTARTYPSSQGERAAQVLGHLGQVSSEELADPQHDYRTDDLIGRGGLEEQYDQQLRGIDGWHTVAVDTAGRVGATLQEKAPIAGATLITSLDAKLQAVVEQQLAAAVARARSTGNAADSGAAVVVDVTDGRVLAMASYPDYAPSVWEGGIAQAEYQKLLDSHALLLTPVQGTYAPGSTFKPFTVAAMSAAGLDLGARYPCPSTYSAGGRFFANHESQAYGTISLLRAIELSCNTVFYGVADQLWQLPGAADQVATSAASFGLGSASGIDLPGEAAGVVSGATAMRQLWLDNKAKWCSAAAAGYPELRASDPAKADEFTALDRENCESGGAWRQGDALNAAIGQGLTAVTPLQLAMAYAAIGNGGTLYRPQVARAMVAADGTTTTFEPAVRAQVQASPETLAFLTSALAGVTTEGTAAAAFHGFPLEAVPVAGKTGSAQVPGGKAPTSWFASFAPANQPRYAVVMMVTQGDTGAGTSAPSVRAIYEALFGISGGSVDPANSVLVGAQPAAELPTVAAR